MNIRERLLLNRPSDEQRRKKFVRDSLMFAAGLLCYAASCVFTVWLLRR